MSSFEIDHPLGSDIQKIHGALMLGMAEQSDLLNERMELEFGEVEEENGLFTRLKLASWTTKNLVWVENPISIPEYDPDWVVDWGAGAEPVRQRIKVVSMLSKGFITTFSESGNSSPYIKLETTDNGVAITIDEAGEPITHFGNFDSQAYGRITSIAHHQASIGELAILADAV